MKTIAAVLSEVNKPLQIEELTIPELKRGQVLVKITYSGICRSQLNEIHGLKGKDNYLPHTLGHEGSGVVEAIGDGVKKVKPGGHVVLTWIKGDGLDAPSTTYQRSDGSTVNSGAISTFLERAIISENRLVIIPDEMPSKEAALLGCAFPTGAGILINTADIQPGSSVAVFGVGGIGLSAIIAARLRCAKTIIAVDLKESKLEQARKAGATDLINPCKQDVETTILEITDKKGVDFAIEAAGKQVAMETAFQSVRDNGGLCVLAGNLPHRERITIDPFDLIRGKRIVGTWGGETKPDRDIPKYVDLYLSGKITLGELSTNTYSLGDINKSFVDIEQGIVGRALIKM